jgi:hypothetical protein
MTSGSQWARTAVALAASAWAAAPCVALAPSEGAVAEAAPAPSPDEVWWTGPMLANTPATPGRGEINGETFFFDQIANGSRVYGSLTLLSLGITDRLALGVKPMIGMTRLDGQTSRLALGDVTLLAQYRMTSPAASAFRPTVAVVLQRGLATGRFDRLDTRPAAALGNGAPSTTVSLYAQQSFTLANGRRFRARTNLSRTFFGRARVEGESVFGTSPGFRGRASPGDDTALIVAGEYSLSRRWALALDLVYERTEGGSVVGRYEPGSGRDGRQRIDKSAFFALAPAIEYNFSADLGMLVGTRVKVRGHNSAPSITPAVALVFAFNP